jgi:peptidoglycan/LPS O-acetylase OafA/YrhL
VGHRPEGAGYAAEMSDNRRLIVPLAVIVGCLAFFLLIVVLVGLTSTDDVNPAVGFPIVLVVLGVVGVIGALAWRAVARRKSDS